MRPPAITRHEYFIDDTGFTEDQLLRLAALHGVRLTSNFSSYKQRPVPCIWTRPGYWWCEEDWVPDSEPWPDIDFYSFSKEHQDKLLRNLARALENL